MKQGDQVYARTAVYGVPKSTVDAVFVADNGDGTVTVAHRNLSGSEFVVGRHDVALKDDTMMGRLVGERDAAPRHDACPDSGTCWHACAAGDCFRRSYCVPLSGVYPNDEWPAEVSL